MESDDRGALYFLVVEMVAQSCCTLGDNQRSIKIDQATAFDYGNLTVTGGKGADNPCREIWLCKPG